MKDINLIPVLLGADLNCYTLARAFYEACGAKAQAFGRYPLGQTQYSRFLNFTAVPNLDNPDILVEVLVDFAKKHPDEPLVVMGCTDDYASLLISCKAELEPYYIVPYIDAPLRDRLVSKADFYALCDEYGIPYPKTKVLTADFSPAWLEPDALGFGYPLIVKPSSSIEYWKHPFDGMQKVYVADSPAQAEAIIREIYASGYTERMIVQDMIPGEDAYMHVLTAYSDRDCKVKMTCLGHVMLEEHTPKGRGNHAAIIIEQNKELTDRVRALLEDLGYRGFANFDIKYDERDGSLRFFEINLRQGRSNHYITAAGINIAELVIRDYFTDEPLENKDCDSEHLWHCVPWGVVKRYVRDEAVKAKAAALRRAGKSTSALWCRDDLRGNPRRLLWVIRHLLGHYAKYKKYCK